MILDWLSIILNEWDAIDLMSHAPDDEYNLEVKKIRTLLQKTSDVKELAKGIQEIFLDTCGSDVFKKTYEDCLPIAKKILAQYEK